MPRLFSLICAAALAVSLCACRSISLGPSKQYSQVDYAHGGVIAGVIHFTGAAPAPVKIDMAQDPVCAMAGDATTREVDADNGRLGGVLVYVSHGLGNRAYPIPRDPVVIDQKGCMFHPHVTAAMVGQQVEFKNSDPTQHNVHMAPTVAGNSAFDISQGPHADPVSRYFGAPELMIPVECNNHPWMHAYLSILANPFYAISAADGSFTIRGLPPGTYTITAVQAKLGSKSAQVTVKAGSTAPLSLRF